MTDTLLEDGVEPIVSEGAVRAFLNLAHGDIGPTDAMIGAAKLHVESLIDRTLESYFDDADYVNTVPEPLRLAVIQCAAAIYEDRDRFTVPDAVHTLVAPYRKWAC